jgi:hypothetical protein
MTLPFHFRSIAQPFAQPFYCPRNHPNAMQKNFNTRTFQKQPARRPIPADLHPEITPAPTDPGRTPVRQPARTAVVGGSARFLPAIRPCGFFENIL